MDQHRSDARPTSMGDATEEATRDVRRKDRFIELMLFNSHAGAESAGTRHGDAHADDYAPLRHLTSSRGDRYTLPVPSAQAPVRLDSPATDVMTDLRRVNAVVIDRNASIDDADRVMAAHGVRALFVVDDTRQVSGIITTTDTLGEKPMRFAQARGIRHGEVVVRDIMTPSERLEILAHDTAAGARVGDVIATLRFAGRQHALVVETNPEAPGNEKTIIGIFSLTQIARQLGVPPQQVHDIARTFAEIEAVIAS
jgi:CBS domain-containing protein